MDTLVILIYYCGLFYAANIVVATMVEYVQEWMANRSEKIIIKHYQPGQRLIFPVVPQQIHAKLIWKNRIRDDAAIDDGLTPHGTKYATMMLGEVILDRYQIVGRLGVGDISSVWLMRDLIHEKYISAKIYAHLESAEAELAAFDKIENLRSPHRGWEYIRQRDTALNIIREEGDWYETILQPVVCNNLSPEFLALKYGTERMPIKVVKSVLYQTLLALDCLHTECKLAHTGIHGGNVFLEMPDTANSSLLDEFVLAELNDTQLRDPDGTSDDTTDDNDTADDRADEFPRPLGMDHSIDGIRVGGLSRSVAADERPYGDSGQAVELPTCVYQAPELMFESEFGYAVDIWSFGCWAWELVHGQPLFSSVLEMEGEGFEDGENRLVGYQAVAWNIRSLLGPPPPDLRTGMANSSHFDRAMFDDEDIWRGPVPFEDARVLLEEDEHLKVDEREQFLDLMKDMVQWRPEDRKTAGELLAHPWFAGFGLFTVPTSDHHQVDDSGGAPSSTTEKPDYANGGPISPTSYGEQDVSA